MDLSDVLNILPASQSAQYQQRMAAVIPMVTVSDAQTIRQSVQKHALRRGLYDVEIIKRARQYGIAQRKEGRALCLCCADAKAVIDAACERTGREPLPPFGGAA